MEREQKYLVIKLADLQNYLPDMEHNEIVRLAQLVKQRRMADGKQDTQYVCVADDWPMYEMVWSLIERWVDSGAPPSMPCYSPDEIAGLQRDAARYRVLREADIDSIHKGGVFAGKTPENIVLNGADLDEAIDSVISE